MRARTIDVSAHLGTIEIELEDTDDFAIGRTDEGNVRIQLPLFNFEAHAITQALKPIVAARGQEVLQ